MKFTFKTEHPTGRYRSFESDHHIVKFNKVEVGSILDGHPFTIRLMVVKQDINEDKNPNCSWKWIRVKKEFESLVEAKTWLNDHVEEITSHFKLVDRED
jgi:hypothetical protein